MAVTSLGSTAADRFEREIRAARQEAEKADNAVPVHTFLHRWGVYVALHRHPDRAARLSALEKAVGEAVSRAEARAGSAGTAALLDEAAREVTGCTQEATCPEGVPSRGQWIGLLGRVAPHDGTVQPG
ncbi:hypothetical protein [Streptomyces sp. ISL-11]|uniref:hypothetical protein n=1 Tax=Streptomyces sp. ISL-11 TaxID=2819174 RepID=UPI001BE968A3|nr:hypothetical protein [Streptomyces sp. ISL-11]MBT2386883.1 hypothetical protein [Streptomyces sp. ISL-11]